MVDSDPARAEERRTSARATTLYRPVLIVTEEIAGFCLLRNISSEGMMARFFTELAAETPVTVRFSPDIAVNGKVSWSHDGKIGIQFAAPMDVPQIIQGLSSPTSEGKNYRAPRLEIQTHINLLLDGRNIPAELQDISQKGIKVRTSYLRTKDEVTVLLGRLQPKKAIVRWTQGHLAGLNFVQALPFEQLGQWVIEENEKTALISESLAKASSVAASR